jgi:hypothetical protein
MVTVLKYGSKKEAIKRLLDRLNQQTESKGIDAYKYCGVLNLEVDPMDIQLKLRDEWK